MTKRTIAGLPVASQRQPRTKIPLPQLDVRASENPKPWPENLGLEFIARNDIVNVHMSETRIVTKHISLPELKQLAEQRFGDMVKAVVDLEKNIMVVGGELHSDQEKLLIEQGSKQENVWGINLYPDVVGDDWLEFDSMINIRPRQNNRSRSVEDMNIQKQIIALVNKLLQ